MMVMQSALLTGKGGWSAAAGLAGGQQQATDRPKGKPYMNPRDNTALLRLRLDYK
ncbi:hypothetical protein ACS1UY_005188 [Escherichia coli]